MNVILNTIFSLFRKLCIQSTVAIHFGRYEGSYEDIRMLVIFCLVLIKGLRRGYRYGKLKKKSFHFIHIVFFARHDIINTLDFSFFHINLTPITILFSFAEKSSSWFHVQNILRRSN